MKTSYHFLLWGALLPLAVGCQSAAESPDRWQPQATGPALSGVQQIAFSTAQAGWVVGGYEVPTNFGGRFTNVLLRTTAGGEPWLRTDLTPTNTARGLRNFCAASNQVLYGVADDLPLSLVPGARARFVYRSADGGQTWQQQPSTGFFDGDLAFATPQVGVAAYSAAIVRTTDGGSTWQPAWRDSLQRQLVTQAHFPTATTGFATGNCVLKTTDQGQTWQALPWANGLIYQSHFLNAEVGFALTQPRIQTGVGPSSPDDSALYRTLDGGQTWERLLSPTQTSNYGFVSAQEFYRGQRSIEHTRDGGRTWQTEYTLPDSDTNNFFVSFSFPGPEAGYAVTSTGTVVKRLVP